VEGLLEYFSDAPCSELPGARRVGNVEVPASQALLGTCLIAPQYENVEVSMRPQFVADGEFDCVTAGDPPRAVGCFEDFGHLAGQSGAPITKVVASHDVIVSAERLSGRHPLWESSDGGEVEGAWPSLRIFVVAGREPS
jgi:hypothetical protein